jgi:hypothetical protein
MQAKSLVAAGRFPAQLSGRLSPLGLDPPSLRAFGRLGRPASLGRAGHGSQQVGEFGQAILAVAALVAG